VGVAVVGVGDHARRNALPALAAVDAVRLVGVHSRDPARRAEAAQRWSCSDFPTYEALLADPRVEAVYVALPVGLHAAAAAAALAAGRHVWCEKSLTAALPEALRLLDAARAADLALCECFMFRHHAQLARVRALLREGAVGRVRSLTARFGVPHLAAGNVRYDRALGGGALLDLGCYPLSAARALLGEPAEVAASSHRDEGYAVDTAGAALLRFGGGATALLDWGFGRAYRNEIEVWGDAATLSVERAFSKPATLATALVTRPAAGERREETVAADDHFAAMFRALAGAVREPAERARHRDEAEAQARAMDRLRRATHLEHP
jgi:predicted dehydrogenase